MTRDRYIVLDNNGMIEVLTQNVPTLGVLQTEVGGLIEPLFTEPMGKNEVTAYVNEEGWLLGLTPRQVIVRFGVEDHRVQFAGDMVIIGLSPEGETILLTEEESKHILQSKEDGVITLF